jgi:hypothetical protein
MKKWQAWREDYRKVLTPDNQSPNASERATAVPMLSSIIPLLADAQQKNAELNEGRRKQFQKSIRAAAVAMVAVAGQAFFRLTLHLQGM